MVKMNKEEMIKNIEDLPVFDIKDVEVDNVLQKKWKAIIEVGETEAINIVSKRYNLVQLKVPNLEAIKDLEDFDGELLYHNGISVMNVFPNQTTIDGFQYGFSVINSVTSETSVSIKFCIGYRGRVLRIPPIRLGGLKRFSKTHSNKEALKITQEYLDMLTKVREYWGVIVTEFPKIKVTEIELEKYKEDFDLSDELLETAKRIPNLNLWGLIMLKFNAIAGGRNKSDIHESQKYDDLTKQIFNLGITMKLFGGN
jgi:hypothetical protein